MKAFLGGRGKYHTLPEGSPAKMAIDEAKRILAETEPTKRIYAHVPCTRLVPSVYAVALTEALENFLKD